MTQAYADGFRKTAEALGVDPDTLAKEAGLGQLIGRGVSHVKRIGQLLNGGNQQMLGSLRNQNQQYLDEIKRLKGLRSGNNSEIRKEIAKVWGARAGLLGGTGAAAVGGYKMLGGQPDGAAE